MSLRAILKAAWNDSVWSKVIAAGIIAGLGAGGAYWPTLKSAALSLLAVLPGGTRVPVWLLVVLAFLIVAALPALSVYLWRGWRTHAVMGTDRLPIREAMRLAYEQLEDDPEVSPFIEEGNRDNPEGKLQYLADVLLCMDPPFDIEGEKPPSTVPRKLEDDRRSRLHLIEGTNDLSRIFGDSRPAYVNVTISRASLAQFIERLRGVVQ